MEASTSPDKNKHEERRKSSILKSAQQQRPHHQTHDHSNEHVKFDESVIEEHDKDRGTRQKIDEPKTPFQYDQDELLQAEDDSMQDQIDKGSQSEACEAKESQKEDIQMVDETVVKVIDEEVKKHLEEAEKNKQLNAQLQEERKRISVEHHNSELQEKLTQMQEAADEEEKKHLEFSEKRKQHYKSEFSPAMLLKQQISLEEEEEEGVN